MRFKMKELLILMMCCVTFSRSKSVDFENPQQRMDVRFVSRFNKDIDWSQKFLDVIKDLSAERLNHKLTADEYVAKLNKIRQAVLSKKQREERKKLEEDQDSELLRNTILLEPALTFRPSLTKINELDRIMNILDKLMIRLEYTTVAPVEITQCPVASTVSKYLPRNENDDILTTKGSQDVSTIHTPEVQYKYQTERDLSKYQSNLYQQLQNPNPRKTGFRGSPGGSGYNQPPAPGYNEPAIYPPAGQTYNQPQGQAYVQPNAQPVEQEHEGDETQDFEQDMNKKDDHGDKDEEQWSEDKAKRRSTNCSNGKHRPGCNCNKGRRSNRNLDQETTDLNRNESKNDEKNEDDNKGSILDTVILCMIAVVATQLCILVFLVILKDKLIVCLALKYGQIKVCSVPQN